MINILFTSSGAKVELVKSFRKAFVKEKVVGGIFCADADPLAPTLIFPKSFVLPLRSDTFFMKVLKEKCLENKITHLLSASDDEMLFYAKKKKEIESWGVKLLFSGIKTLRSCNSKHETYKMFLRLGVPTPKTSLDIKKALSFKFPIIVKENKGAGSKKVFKATKPSHLKVFAEYFSKPLFQEFVEGEEITVDAYSTLRGKFIGAVSRLRLEVSDGEAVKTMTLFDKEGIAFCKKIIKEIGSVGHVNIQYFKTQKGYKFIEVNPRFGGSSSIAFVAGLNSSMFLLKELCGIKVVKPERIAWGLFLTKYYECDYGKVLVSWTKKWEKVIV